MVCNAEDDLHLTPSDDHFFQRYALVTFYRAFDGSNWDGYLNWLNGSNQECDWKIKKNYTTQGLTKCSTDRYLTNLTIGKYLDSDG